VVVLRCNNCYDKPKGALKIQRYYGGIQCLKKARNHTKQASPFPGRKRQEKPVFALWRSKKKYLDINKSLHIVQVLLKVPADIKQRSKVSYTNRDDIPGRNTPRSSGPTGQKISTRGIYRTDCPEQDR
jgi:hypothetical protein